jgi:hypothetical protein
VNSQPATGRLIATLLAAILLCQSVLLWLHFRKDSERGSAVAPTTTETLTTIEPAPPLQLEGKDSQLQELAQRLVNVVEQVPELANYRVQLDEVRVDSATSTSDVRVTARVHNESPVPLSEVVCRLQLLDEKGSMVYQAYGRVRGVTEEVWQPGHSGRLGFVIDNPPEFNSARIALERLEFIIEEYEAK